MEEELISQLDNLVSSHEISKSQVKKLLLSYLEKILEMVLQDES